jgi:hypothetical protein
MADTKLYCNVMNEPLSHQLSCLSSVNCTSNVIDFGIKCTVGTDMLRKPIFFPMDNANASSIQTVRLQKNWLWVENTSR